MPSDDKLAEQPSHARADSGAHRDLAAADFRAGQQQVGDVDAGDQQHEYHRAQQDQHRLAHRVHHFVLEARQHDGVDLGIEGMLSCAPRCGRDCRS